MRSCEIKKAVKISLDKSLQITFDKTNTSKDSTRSLDLNINKINC